MFLRSRYWIGIWPETGAAAQVPAYLLGPIIAGAAAWTAATPVRHAVTEQLTAARVHPAKLEAYRLGSTAIVLAIPYLIGQAVAFVLTARTFPPGLELWFGYFMLGLFIIMLTTAVGWMFGKLFNSVFATLTATLATLLLLGMLDRGLGAIVVSGPPEVEVSPSALVLRFVLIVVALAAMLRLRGTDQEPKRGSTLTAALALGVVIVTMFGSTVVADRPPAGNHVICVNGATALCIWPEHKKYVPLLRQLNGRLAALPKSFLLPTRMDEFGIQPTGHTTVGNNEIYNLAGPDQLPTFYILAGSPWSIAGDLSNAVLDKTFGFTNTTTCTWASRTDPDRARLLALGAWLESYLAGGGTPDYKTDAPTEMQDAWTVGRAVARNDSRSQQFSWADGEVNDLRGRYCHP
jgi:hypothetical protein